MKKIIEPLNWEELSATPDADGSSELQRAIAAWMAAGPTFEERDENTTPQGE